MANVSAQARPPEPDSIFNSANEYHKIVQLTSAVAVTCNAFSLAFFGLDEIIDVGAYLRRIGIPFFLPVTI